MSLVIYKGIPWTYRMTATVKDTGALQDLTGVALSFVVRKTAGSSALVTLTVGSGITLLAQSGATLGQADLLIPGATTGALDAGIAEATLVGTIGGLDRLLIPPTTVLVRAL
jgi:hypothetical protein